MHKILNSRGEEIVTLTLDKDKKSTVRELKNEIGSGGIGFLNGALLNEEFNEKLTGKEGVKTYDLLRRTDAQVAGILHAVMLPLLSATWRADRPEETGQADLITDDHLAFLNDNLFTRINFEQFLRHALSSIWAGFSWFEKVYDVDEDNRFVFKHISSRLASTVNKWYPDESGHLIGIEQETYKGTAFHRVDIPRDKIVLFTFMQEGNNFEGMSLLRPVYKHFKIKDTLYRADAIRFERFGIGVPVITLPEEYTDDMMELAKKIGKSWRGASQSYIVLINGMTVEIVQADGGKALDFIPSIQHHNEEMAKAFLTQFINYGTTQSGSRSLGETSQNFFYDAVEGLGEWIARTIEAELAWPLMDLNFEGPLRPRVVVEDVGTVSLEELRETLKELGDFVPPADDIEDVIRNRLKLAPRPEPEEGEEPSKRAPARKAAPVKEGDTPEGEETTYDLQAHVHLKQSGQEFTRELLPEEKHVRFRQIAGRLDDDVEAIQAVILRHRDEWVAALTAATEAAIPGGPLAIGRIDVALTATDAMVDDIVPILDDMYAFGQEQVREEIERQARANGLTLKRSRVKSATITQQQTTALFRDTPPNVGDVIALISERAIALAERVRRRVVDATQAIGRSFWRTQGQEGGAVAAAAVRGDILAAVEAEARLAALGATTEALNLGRDAEAQRFLPFIQTALYSSLLDLNSCAQCSRADGFTTQVGTDSYYDTLPPLRSQKFGACGGWDRCRCIYVFVLADEQPEGG